MGNFTCGTAWETVATGTSAGKNGVACARTVEMVTLSAWSDRVVAPQPKSRSAKHSAYCIGVVENSCGGELWVLRTFWSVLFCGSCENTAKHFESLLGRMAHRHTVRGVPTFIQPN